MHRRTKHVNGYAISRPRIKPKKDGTFFKVKGDREKGYVKGISDSIFVDGHYTVLNNTGRQLCAIIIPVPLLPPSPSPVATVRTGPTSCRTREGGGGGRNEPHPLLFGQPKKEASPLLHAPFLPFSTTFMSSRGCIKTQRFFFFYTTYIRNAESATDAGIAYSVQYRRTKQKCNCLFGGRDCGTLLRDFFICQRRLTCSRWTSPRRRAASSPRPDLRGWRCRRAWEKIVWFEIIFSNQSCVPSSSLCDLPSHPGPPAPVVRGELHHQPQVAGEDGVANGVHALQTEKVYLVRFIHLFFDQFWGKVDDEP